MPKVRGKRKGVKELNRDGVTVLVVTHNLEIAQVPSFVENRHHRPLYYHAVIVCTLFHDLSRSFALYFTIF